MERKSTEAINENIMIIFNILNNHNERLKKVEAEKTNGFFKKIFKFLK